MSVHSDTSCPEVVLASIAWYPDQLDEERRGLVESHAAECFACREELDFVQGEADPQIDLPELNDVYAAVLARIERSETRDRRSKALQSLPRRQRSAFGARPAALAAGIALALLVGGVGGLWLGAESPPIYRPAVEPSEVAVSSVLALDVVFRPDARAESIHAALRVIGGEIVSGPTQLGVYQVHLSPTADRVAAAQLLRGEGQGVATFAEPAPR